MVKTQIQIPEDLYAELKNLAKRKEWSLAETLRRGGEYLLELYPDGSKVSPGEWTPPAARHLGWKGLSVEQMHEVVLDDMDPSLP